MMTELQLTPVPGRRGQLYFMRGDQKQVIARNLDLSDPATVHPVIDRARQQYPTQELKIAVFKPNGSSLKEESIISLSDTPPASDSFTPPVFPAASSPRPSSAPLPGVDHFTAYLMGEKDLRIAEKDEQIRELRDALRISEENARGLKSKNEELSLDLRFKDREHAMELSGLEQQKKGGLGGLMETISILPPEVLTPLLGRFFGGAAPSAPSAPAYQLTGALSLAHQHAISATSNHMQQVDELTAQKLQAVVQRLATDPESLERVISVFATPNP